MNTQFSRKVMLMQMSGTKCHGRRECTQNANGRRVQLEITIKGRTEVQLKTFAASVSEFFSEIWLEEIFWAISHVEKWSEDHGRSLTSIVEGFGINKSIVSRAWKAFQTIGIVVRKIGGVRLRNTTAMVD
ncbi:hypothetical protein TNCV_962491 [Trichonephila clavipes]|nr:hypothetical protein TNCV_962491 [Trichonephila clavipes]